MVSLNINSTERVNYLIWEITTHTYIVTFFKDVENVVDVVKAEDDFKKKLKNNQKASVDFSKALSSGNKAEALKKFGALGKSCKACHDKYKEDW